MLLLPIPVLEVTCALSIRDNAVAESKDENVKTLDDLLKICNVDLEYWEVERHIINKWEVAAKDNVGELRHSPLYQVKAWLKAGIMEELQTKINLDTVPPNTIGTESGKFGTLSAFSN